MTMGIRVFALMAVAAGAFGQASGPDAKNGGKQYSAIAAYLGEKGGTA